MVIRPIERAPRVGAPQPLEDLLVANMHPQSYLRLPAVTPEVSLAHQEAQEESHGEIVLLTARLGRFGAWKRCSRDHGGNHTCGVVSPSSCVLNNGAEAGIALSEFSTGWRGRMASPTRENPTLRRVAWGNSG